MVLGKRRTMEIYLNVVEWAPGVFGAEAAAQHYFGRPASGLTGRAGAAGRHAPIRRPAIPPTPGRAKAQASRIAGLAKSSGATSVASRRSRLYSATLP